MVSLTLSVPPLLRKRMHRHRHIRWSELVRATIEKQLDELEEADAIAAKSKLTQKDVDEISRKIDAEMAAHFEGLRHAARN
ncbi:MAG: hypothetical protein V1835_01365 [Candidatus Micrarchaeota archaeon]